jgi:hypothetical protein
MLLSRSLRGGVSSPRRADVGAATVRRGRWWRYPLATFTVLFFVIYGIYATLANRDYFSAPYLSPFCSPCLATGCWRVLGSAGAPQLSWFGTWWVITPAVIVLIFPLGFRLTCYYYRKAYYRSWWLSPPSCAVRDAHPRYSGETRFALILQNVHRYFLYAALAFNLILIWDAIIAFDWDGSFGMGLGTLVLVVYAVLLWLYTLSGHACRHVVGGRLRSFCRHPLRYRFWTMVSRMNPPSRQLRVGVADLGRHHRRLHPAGRQRHDPRSTLLLTHQGRIHAHSTP